MKTNTIIPMVLAVSLLVPMSTLWADDTTNDVKSSVEHPETTYHQHEVKSDAVDVQELSQRKAEVKAKMDQAKTDYEASLSKNGADSDVTKDAKKRLDHASKEYRKLAMKTSNAHKELGEDSQKLQEDKVNQ